MLSLVLLLVVYPLSAGPACKLAGMGYLNATVLRYFYMPLAGAIAHSPGLQRLFEWYIRDVWKTTYH
jgi:hypothetical protein